MGPLNSDLQLCRWQHVTHLGEGFNGAGEDGFLHVRRDPLQAHDAVQHTEDGLVLALFLQKSKANEWFEKRLKTYTQSNCRARSWCVTKYS